jgi:hypothetical protein
MAILDPTTNIGKLRLRVADWQDLQIFPDNVYQSALDDNQGSLPRAALLMAQYILASLTAQTHQKMYQVEVFGKEWFDNYVIFMKMTILNPNLMTIAPIPYGAGIVDAVGKPIVHPLVQFQKDWNLNYSSGTQSEYMHLTAAGGFLSGETYGL